MSPLLVPSGQNYIAPVPLDATLSCDIASVAGTLGNDGIGIQIGQLELNLSNNINNGFQLTVSIDKLTI